MSTLKYQLSAVLINVGLSLIVGGVQPHLSRHAALALCGVLAYCGGFAMCWLLGRAEVIARRGER
jgi:hypothetical protein